MVLTTFQILTFLYNFQNFNKIKNLAGCPILHTFSPPQNHQNSQQPNFHVLPHRRSRTRGVAKVNFGTPMLHGAHFFFVVRTQRGSAIFTLDDTSPARMRFFSFFQHLPSENQKNQQNRISKPWFGRVGAKGAKSKSTPKLRLNL